MGTGSVGANPHRAALRSELCQFMVQMGREFVARSALGEPYPGVVAPLRSRYHDPDPPVPETASAIVARREAARQHTANRMAPGVMYRVSRP